VPVAGVGAGLRRPWMVLPPLVSAEFRPPADRLGLQASLGLTAPVIGMVSTFQPSRRHDVALAAFRLVLAREPRATLVLVGDGQLGPALRARAEALGLAAQVRFPGYQSGSSLVRWIQAFDELWVLGLGNDEAGRPALQGRAVDTRVVAVAEGALAAWADAVIAGATAEALAAVALRGDRRTVAVPEPRRVAAELLELYTRAGARP
jgi:glycosyltransferase involved in cell wall biosynthesis